MSAIYSPLEGADPFDREVVFESFFKHSPVSKVVLDCDQTVLLANDSCEKLLGHKASEISGMQWTHFIHEDDLDLDKQSFKDLLHGAIENYSITKRLKHSEGHILWAILNVSIGQRMDSGRVTIVTVTIQDITKTKKLLSDLSESEQLLSEVGKIGKIGGWERDMETNQAIWTRAIYRIFNLPYDKQTPNQEPRWNVYAKDEVEKVKKAFDELKTTGKPLDLITRLKRSNDDGPEGWVRIVGTAELKEGKVIKIRGIVQDVTRQIRDQEKLFESQENYRFLYEHTSDLISVHAPDGEYLETSPSVTRHLGYEPSELIGKSAYKLTHPDDMETLKKVHKRVLQTNLEVREQCRFRHKEGHHVWLDIIVDPILNSQGEVTSIISSSRDITTIKTQEAFLTKLNTELKRSNQELMEFAYVASHDLQEPLRMISSFTELLATKYKDQLDKRAQGYISYAVDGSRRLQVMINDLLLYSRINMQDTPKEIVDMNGVLTRVRFSLAKKIKESKAQVTCEELPSVLAIPGQMDRLVQNIIDNAIKYRSEKSPEIKITCKEVNNHYEFSVSDNGIGMKREYFNKIFVIFQRLHPKHQYSGTGIGLAICSRIIHRHDGKIWVDSELGKGSSLHFTIPTNTS